MRSLWDMAFDLAAHLDSFIAKRPGLCVISLLQRHDLGHGASVHEGIGMSMNSLPRAVPPSEISVTLESQRRSAESSPTRRGRSTIDKPSHIAVHAAVANSISPNPASTDSPQPTALPQS